MSITDVPLSSVGLDRGILTMYMGFS